MSLQGGILFFIALFDAFITGFGVNAGHLTELNPIALWLMDNAGVLLFILFKAMFVLLVVSHFDRMLKQDEESRLVAVRCYRLAILSYTAYFVLPWLVVNHEYIMAFFHKF